MTNTKIVNLGITCHNIMPTLQVGNIKVQRKDILRQLFYYVFPERDFFPLQNNHRLIFFIFVKVHCILRINHRSKSLNLFFIQHYPVFEALLSHILLEMITPLFKNILKHSEQNINIIMQHQKDKSANDLEHWIADICFSVESHSSNINSLVVFSNLFLY